MTVDEVSTIIDQICGKLGLAVDSMSELVPELVRLKIAENAVTLSLCIILVVAESIFMYTQYKAAEKFAKEHSWAVLTDYVPWNVAWSLGIVVGCTCAVLIPMSLNDLIKWCVSPTVAAIEYILSLM